MPFNNNYGGQAKSMQLAISVLTGAVLSVLLVLRVEVVDGVGHDVPWVHCLLQAG